MSGICHPYSVYVLQKRKPGTCSSLSPAYETSQSRRSTYMLNLIMTQTRNSRKPGHALSYSYFHWEIVPWTNSTTPGRWHLAMVVEDLEIYNHRLTSRPLSDSDRFDLCCRKMFAYILIDVKNIITRITF